ncbi:MAG: hypothetical protein FJY15_03315 [Bacteroidetes bacterium]|nr:hypothetical protein [Bacteroidota bacterium]
MKHVLFALAIPALAFLSSCGGGSDPDAAPKPTLSFQTGSGFTFDDAQAGVDDILKIGVIAKSNDSKLNKVTINLSTNGGTPGVIFDTTVNANGATFTYNFKVQGSVTDVLKLTVTASDANGTTAEQSLSIEITPATVAIGLQQNQYIYNLQSPAGYNGAYDLTKSSAKYSNDNRTEKDIIDGTPSSAVFSKSWTTGNGSKFVKVSANDYNLSTSSTFIYNLWKTNAANATATATDLKLGDVILVKSGQSVPFGLYIVKITEVKETTTDNLDYIRFEYKGDI